MGRLNMNRAEGERSSGLKLLQPPPGVEFAIRFPELTVGGFRRTTSANAPLSRNLGNHAAQLADSRAQLQVQHPRLEDRRSAVVLRPDRFLQLHVRTGRPDRRL